MLNGDEIKVKGEKRSNALTSTKKRHKSSKICDNSTTLPYYFYGESLGGLKNGCKKVNQDAILMMTDKQTSSLIFASFDGHGLHGHIISEVIDTTPCYLLNTNTSIIDVLHVLVF